MRPLHQFSTLKAANNLSQLTQGALIQFLMESITYLKDSYHKPDLTTTGVLLLSVLPLPK